MSRTSEHTAGAVADDVRCRVKRLKRVAASLAAEIGRLEADLELAEVGVPVPAPGPYSLTEEIQRHEAALIRHVLIDSGWNTAEAARRLGLKPNTLHYKLRQHGFCRPDKRREL